MLKTVYLYLILFCLCLGANVQQAQAGGGAGDAIKILQTADRKIRARQVVTYLRSYFTRIPADSIQVEKAELHRLFLKHHIDEGPALEYFVDNVCKRRVSDYAGAERDLLKALEQAGKNADHYLNYALYSQLAFLQIYRGNTIGGVESYRLAKKEAIELNDPDMQITVDVNISDVYYKNNFYSQALVYLNQALILAKAHTDEEFHQENIIYFNKAEIYFRMGKLDSVKKYYALLNDGKRNPYRLLSFQKRAEYFVTILEKKYQLSISKMQALRRDTLFGFDDSDEEYLTDVFYKAGMLDSAKAVIMHLLDNPAFQIRPERSYHQYELLGEIAAKQGDDKMAAQYSAIALQQLKSHLDRLTQVGDISSQMKIDEIQGSYARKAQEYRTQRMWMIFIVVVSLLTISMGTMFYHNIRQKRYYEKLLHATQKEELAYINSHEVRRHLSNVLGLIDLVKHSDNKDKEYREAEEYLLIAAENLDEAIKNISEKLDN